LSSDIDHPLLEGLLAGQSARLVGIDFDGPAPQDLVDEFGLGGEVLVEGARADAEVTGQLGHHDATGPVGPRTLLEGLEDSLALVITTLLNRQTGTHGPPP